MAHGLRPFQVAGHLFRARLEDGTYLGTTEVTLPNLSSMTSEVTGAGVAGAIDMPLLGLLQSMTMTLNFRTVNKEQAALMKGERVHIELKQAIQEHDDGKHVFQPQHIVAEGFFKTLTSGKMALGQTQDRSFEMEISYFKESYGKEELAEIDKLNEKYVVLGTDYLEAARQAVE